MSKFGNARTKAQLERQFQTLSKLWWDGLPGKFAVNGYECQECHGIIMTVDLDPGTTPAFMGCKAKAECQGRMDSFGYPAAPPPRDFHKLVKVFEWYRPEANALGLFHKDQQVDEYIRRGGLLLRERDASQGMASGNH